MKTFQRQFKKVGVDTIVKALPVKAKNTRVTLLIPHSHPTFSTNFVISFIGLLSMTYSWNNEQGNRYQFEILVSGNGWIDKIRNSLAQDALTTGSDIMIWFDTDQLYPPDTIIKFLRHLEDNADVEAVGGLITYKDPPYLPHVYAKLDPKSGTYHMARTLALDQLMQVDGAGFGCIAIRSIVFLRTPQPWFEFKMTDNGEMISGEDLSFCVKAKMKILIDPTIVIKHLKENGYDINDYISFNKLKVENGKLLPSKALSNKIYDSHLGKINKRKKVIKL